MIHIRARPRKNSLPCRALLYSQSLFMLSCGTCSKEVPKPSAEVLEQGQSLASERLFDFIPKTCGKEITQSPFLFGQFIDPARRNAELSIKDIFSPHSVPPLCPPGPFLIDGSSAVDIQEKKWTFSSTPDYFLWYSLDDITDYDFYLTDQGGFPVKSQSIKLNQEKDSLLVLLPKAKLEVGKTYYLYLVQRFETNKKTWIQPLGLVASNKS